MIRKATVDDLRPIYDMMEAYFHEAIDKVHYPLEWDRERAVIYLGNLLWRETGLNFVSENLEGMILGEIGETWFGPNVMAKPAVLYVKPEHRNGLIARALLRRFEKEALERNAFAILWEFESGLSDNKMLSGLMNNLGYEYQGPIYKKIFGGDTCHR
jgi:GNAT superfamily N-acetyltransferase